MMDTIVGYAAVWFGISVLVAGLFAAVYGKGQDHPASVRGVAAICPECRNGKHVNCVGQAWDDEADELTVCECGYGVCAGAST